MTMSEEQRDIQLALTKKRDGVKLTGIGANLE